jgi:hypothetical protein
VLQEHHQKFNDTSALGQKQEGCSCSANDYSWPTARWTSMLKITFLVSSWACL